ncbi:cyclophilin-like fold protein [Methanolobus profundi]|uniref:Cyclophilin-like n=1 Tax=Methanolobus profundi TaxID=487685 RepID=A0A1I4S3N3_9EURY|nr:cyclophilin-like fold protein [Methanolobus profundi]SFM59069.1 Cyclophilin-like [Methanolobus profundi]
MATRKIKNGTKIKMHFGSKVIPGILNDSEPSRELISRLPYTVQASRYEFDVCGVMDEPLSFGDEDLVPGWKNGDIDFTTQGDYFTILFDNEENCYGEFVNLGVIDCDPSTMASLKGSFDILIELA